MLAFHLFLRSLRSAQALYRARQREVAIETALTRERMSSELEAARREHAELTETALALERMLASFEDSLRLLEAASAPEARVVLGERRVGDHSLVARWLRSGWSAASSSRPENATALLGDSAARSVPVGAAPTPWNVAGGQSAGEDDPSRLGGFFGCTTASLDSTVSAPKLAGAAAPSSPRRADSMRSAPTAYLGSLPPSFAPLPAKPPVPPVAGSPRLLAAPAPSIISPPFVALLSASTGAGDPRVAGSVSEPFSASCVSQACAGMLDVGRVSPQPSQPVSQLHKYRLPPLGDDGSEDDTDQEDFEKAEIAGNGVSSLGNGTGSSGNGTGSSGNVVAPPADGAAVQLLNGGSASPARHLQCSLFSADAVIVEDGAEGQGALSADVVSEMCSIEDDEDLLALECVEDADLALEDPVDVTTNSIGDVLPPHEFSTLFEQPAIVRSEIADGSSGRASPSPRPPASASHCELGTEGLLTRASSARSLATLDVSGAGAFFLPSLSPPLHSLALPKERPRRRPLPDAVVSLLRELTSRPNVALLFEKDPRVTPGQLVLLGSSQSALITLLEHDREARAKFRMLADEGSDESQHGADEGSDESQRSASDPGEERRGGALRRDGRRAVSSAQPVGAVDRASSGFTRGGQGAERSSSEPPIAQSSPTDLLVSWLQAGFLDAPAEVVSRLWMAHAARMREAIAFLHARIEEAELAEDELGEAEAGVDLRRVPAHREPAKPAGTPKSSSSLRVSTGQDSRFSLDEARNGREGDFWGQRARRLVPPAIMRTELEELNIFDSKRCGQDSQGRAHSTSSPAASNGGSGGRPRSHARHGSKSGTSNVIGGSITESDVRGSVMPGSAGSVPAEAFGCSAAPTPHHLPSSASPLDAATAATSSSLSTTGVEPPRVEPSEPPSLTLSSAAPGVVPPAPCAAPTAGRGAPRRAKAPSLAARPEMNQDKMSRRTDGEEEIANACPAATGRPPALTPATTVGSAAPTTSRRSAPLPSSQGAPPSADSLPFSDVLFASHQPYVPPALGQRQLMRVPAALVDRPDLVQPPPSAELARRQYTDWCEARFQEYCMLFNTLVCYRPHVVMGLCNGGVPPEEGPAGSAQWRGMARAIDLERWQASHVRRVWNVFVKRQAAIRLERCRLLDVLTAQRVQGSARGPPRPTDSPSASAASPPRLPFAFDAVSSTLTGCVSSALALRGIVEALDACKRKEHSELAAFAFSMFAVLRPDQALRAKSSMWPHAVADVIELAEGNLYDAKQRFGDDF